MSARILVVDDIPSNVRLLEARLMAEYFNVLTATNGASALSICEQGDCDIVLLDVMMPEMDGFEVCRKLKTNAATMHIPVIMVTALDGLEDRVKGLEAGADDFLNKPIDDLELITRVKSLVRMKMISDDLRMRAASGDELVVSHFRAMGELSTWSTQSKIALVDDREPGSVKLDEMLSKDASVRLMSDADEALIQIAEGDYDLAIISLAISNSDSLRLCSHLRSLERTRNMPILVIADPGQDALISRALELGVNDYVRRPVEISELKARLRTLMQRKRYNDCLRHSVQETIEMAFKDSLTGLYNRRHFDNQYPSVFDKSLEGEKNLSTIMIDIDHFKSINDNHGHAVGDQVIRECARRIRKTVRENDLACRYGGEEFVIVMPETDLHVASLIAERIRMEMSENPIKVASGDERLTITVSIGVSSLAVENDTTDKLMKRADNALYDAKRGGRNQVVSQAA